VCAVYIYGHGFNIQPKILVLSQMPVTVHLAMAEFFVCLFTKVEKQLSRRVFFVGGKISTLQAMEQVVFLAITFI